MQSRSQLHFLPAIGKIVLIAALGAAVTMTSAFALNVATPAPLVIKANDQASGDRIEVRAFGRRGGAMVGPRGNVAVRNTAVVGRRGGWARPGWYGWPRGGAIAAGAAIGFVSAATAAAWAGAAPAPGMCWYYTDPSRTQGFWDYCR